jgi:lipoate-protein ligase A
VADAPWRLIVDRNAYADFSVSVSPAVEKAVVEGRVPPTVFLDIFDADSVTVGVNEDPEQVLDLDFCRDQGIDFRRRVNGGGAVYAGTGSAFLVLFLPTDHPRVPGTAAEAFPYVLTKTAEVFQRRFGFPAAYRPLNDIEVEGRKLVPTSLKIEDGVATFRLVVNVKPVDVDVAARIMPMPPEKVADKPLKDLQSRFTWLEREAGREVGEDELVLFAREVVEHAFGETALVEAELTAAERADAKEFRARYHNDTWLYGKSRRTRLDPLMRAGDSVGTGRTKAMGGMIWATLAVRDGTVIHAIVNGDWHPRPIRSVEWLEEALNGSPAEIAALAERVEAFLSRADVEFAGIEPGDMVTALEKALAALEPMSVP